MSKIIEQLKTIMRYKGISQVMLAERTGLTETTISRYMNGTREPSLSNLEKMAKAVGCKVVLIDEI